VTDKLRIPAEQALLGSVLLDPAGQQQVLDLVEPNDMYRPWHGQVLSAMQRLRGRGVTPGPLDVYAELRGDPDLPESVCRDAIPLTDLMEAAPRSGHAGAYAAVVAEGGIRQRLELAGSRLAQAAESGDLDTVLRQGAQAHRMLSVCRARWLAIPQQFRSELSPNPVWTRRRGHGSPG
jgi:replicative DNA helicase